MSDELTVKVQARVARRGHVGRAASLDGRIGDIEATARTRPALAEALARQLRALALHPCPLYRRLCDGRGLIARVTGAEDDGALSYTLDRVHPDGRCAGSEFGAFKSAKLYADDRVGVATLDSTPDEVGAALRRLIEHEVRRFAECSGYAAAPEERPCDH